MCAVCALSFLAVHFRQLQRENIQVRRPKFSTRTLSSRASSVGAFFEDEK